MPKNHKRKGLSFKPKLQPVAEEVVVNVVGEDKDHRSCGDSDDDGGDVSSSAASSVSVFQGDSACSSEDSSTAVAVEEKEEEGTAVGGGAPLIRRDVKPLPPPRPTPPPPREPRDTTPTCSEVLHQHVKPPVTPQDANIGWFFANWGQVPKAGAKRERIDTVLKKNPATVIGLCECDAVTDAQLRVNGTRGTTRDVDDPQLRVKNVMDQRDAVSYLTIRGHEEHSILLGVRQGLGNDLKMLFWERRSEGTYKRSGNRGRANAYSRCLIARVTLDLSVRALGNSHVVMVNHVHNIIANLGARSPKLIEHMAWLADKIRTYNVQVIMGDYNMSLFHAVESFRSCGIILDVGAWYPWKSLDGTPMSDSCGIFFVNLPGEYKLYNGLACLHAEGDTGLFHKSSSSLAVGREECGYDRIEAKAGPGMPLKTYVPKGDDVDNWDMKIRKFVTPCAKSAALVEQYRKVKSQAAGKNFRKDEVELNFLRMKEKRLEVAHWHVEGPNVGGSHFPLCVFTNNGGRRSPEREAARRRAKTERKNARRSGGAVEEGEQEREHAAQWRSGREWRVEEPRPERSNPADGHGWSSSSWVSSDGTESHFAQHWWSSVDGHRSGGAISDSQRGRSWQ